MSPGTPCINIHGQFTRYFHIFHHIIIYLGNIVQHYEEVYQARSAAGYVYLLLRDYKDDKVYKVHENFIIIIMTQQLFFLY